MTRSAGIDQIAALPRGFSGPFFGYFLWASKESDPRVSAEAFSIQQTTAQLTATSAWIPAFAGMTAKGKPWTTNPSAVVKRFPPSQE